MAYSSRKQSASFLRNLNVQEPAIDDFITDEEMARDLAMFTNTQFYDFDSGQNTDFQAPPAKPEVTEKQPATTAATPADSIMEDFSSMDFMSGDFNFGNFSADYTSPSLASFPENHLANLQPLPPNPQTGYHAPVHQQQPGYATSRAAAAGDKLKTDSAPPVAAVAGPSRPLSFEEASRLAAEEDKRRRNTAASARFRVKKKQREQALEKSAKEMTDKVTALETRVTTLEMENKWLRDMLMEKHDGKVDLDKLWKAFSIAKTSKKGKFAATSSSSSESDESDAKSEVKAKA